ncbi:MAG: hypothetical protein CM1200mP23_4270 [Nitrososphaerota archaeon]|nr:MAG: hypothetical protein CM1200mP23_4270 [Nitrososphaerota archaeon]
MAASCDTRSMDLVILIKVTRIWWSRGDGNFDKTFIPNELIFMDGNRIPSMLVERFTCYQEEVLFARLVW